MGKRVGDGLVMIMIIMMIIIRMIIVNCSQLAVYSWDKYVILLTLMTHPPTHYPPHPNLPYPFSLISPPPSHPLKQSPNTY